MGENKKSWDGKIKYALWVDRTTFKLSIEEIMFEIVYGLEAKFPIHLQLPMLQCMKILTIDGEAI